MRDSLLGKVCIMCASMCSYEGLKSAGQVLQVSHDLVKGLSLGKGSNACQLAIIYWLGRAQHLSKH